MSKNKIPFPIFVIIAILALAACDQDALVSKISLVSEPSLGSGIYQLRGINYTGELLWSPEGKVLAGLITSSPLPLPDCPPSPIFCLFDREPFSEIFILDLENQQGQTVLRTERTEKLISRIFWLPDGQHIGYLIYDNRGFEVETWSIDTQGRNDIRISQDSEYPLYSHDGTKWAVVTRDETSGNPSIQIVESSTKQKQQVFETEDSN